MMPLPAAGTISSDCLDTVSAGARILIQSAHIDGEFEWQDDQARKARIQDPAKGVAARVQEAMERRKASG
jgi:hypothetical protein